MPDPGMNLSKHSDPADMDTFGAPHPTHAEIRWYMDEFASKIVDMSHLGHMPIVAVGRFKRMVLR